MSRSARTGVQEQVHAHVHAHVVLPHSLTHSLSLPTGLGAYTPACRYMSFLHMSLQMQQPRKGLLKQPSRSIVIAVCSEYACECARW